MHQPHRTLTRRSFAVASAALIPVSLPGLRALAQTPIAQIGNPDAMVLYAEQRDALLTAGRELVGAFLAGDDAAFAASAANDAFGDFSAATELASLETNRVRLRWPEIGVLLDGHFDGTSTMQGYFFQGAPALFIVTTEDEQSGDVPSGRWDGVIGPGVLDLVIALTFAGGVDDLAATLSIPDQGLLDYPFPEATFHPTLPIGELIQDQALPFGEQNQLYSAEYAWGDTMLAFGTVRMATGGFAGFQVMSRDPLPPDPAAAFESSGPYRLPADGQMIVFWGGITEFQNYHASTPLQRHALDIVVWENGATYRTDGLTNEDYIIWGRSMLAPVGGTVVAMVNDSPDIPPAIAAGTAPSPASPVAASPVVDTPAHPAGNHVVIQTAEREFVFLAHMQQGSVSVAIGDTVVAGDPVGLIGNSGNTSESHIHIHAQTSADLFDPAAMGIPMEFSSLLINGELVEVGSPVQGDFVEAV